jgi:hypothetical protein
MSKHGNAAFIITAIISLLYAGHLAAKPVAYVYSISEAGKISIKKGAKTLKPAKFLNLDENTIVNVGDGAAITIFLSSGKKVAFDQKSSFKVTPSGLEPLDDETKSYLESRGETLVRPIGGSRSPVKNDIPEKVKNEISEIDKNVKDPLMRSLFKVECYNSNGLKKKAKEEFDNYKKLAGDR